MQLSDHLDLIQTRRALEQLIATAAARRATPPQRSSIPDCAANMMRAADGGDLDDYMRADQMLDHACHEACRNVTRGNGRDAAADPMPPLRYAYQHEGDAKEGARHHMAMAERIASGNEAGCGARRQCADGLSGSIRAQGHRRQRRVAHQTSA